MNAFCISLTSLFFFVTFVQAQETSQTLTLPGPAVFPEGVAIDETNGDIYVGSTSSGAVYRGNVQGAPGELTVFLPGGRDGRTSVTGMKVADGRLFIAGRNTGRAFVYGVATGKLIRTLNTPPSPRTLLNGVTVTKDAAYFTDSFRPTLFRASLSDGEVGDLEPWLDLRGKVPYNSAFNLNGISATPDGRYLFTVHFGSGRFYRIDTRTAAVLEVNLGPARLTTGDGLWLEDKTLYVVREKPASVVVLTLNETLSEGEVTATLTHPSLKLPTTLAKYGERLWVVGSQLDGAPTELPFTVTGLLLPGSSAQKQTESKP